ncbi:MAG TPA: energy-coupling factor transporter transmembrane component T [Segeticoccus sp.]|uniref:energy-coupling factor transporter transmembrane component T n=1 Tax=Segeticoccus sp. TaxID=2706531 RepID=UPI002D811540|nr:energy-coupling factor transporter transmembrane component T [Segeticoccus sp.]HET8600357.1 energy-coupling factor transporter transmembrane component T [Segeticoccus sp.]
MRAADRLGLPRLLHPVAWWAWGLGLATAASRTTNPVLLLLVLAVATWCVLERRESGRPGTFAMFLWIGLFAIVLRVVMAALLGGGVTGRVVLFRLPEIPLPAWTSGVRVGGAVTAEGLYAAACEGLRLAAILVCLGAANSLASPRRLLRYLPATLYDVGTAVVVGLTFAPQLAHEAARVRAARRLRGHSGRGLRELARLLVPVLENAFERSMELAASMESRGYGRAVRRSTGSRRTASTLALVGLLGVVAGLYGLLDASTPELLGLPLLLAGALVATAALWAGARRDRRSGYRRDPWGLPEWGVLACGVAPAVVLVVASGRAWPGIVPVQVPLTFPAVPVVAVVGIAAAALAATVSPVPPRRAELRAATSGATPTAVSP